MARIVFFSSSLSSALMSLPMVGELVLGERRGDLLLDLGTAFMRACLSGLCSAARILSRVRRRRARAVLGIGDLERDVHRRDLELGEEALLDVAELADGVLREHQRVEHVLLGHLVARPPRS